MIELKTGNILKADVEALVNTVNCVGVMGKGIALQFKKAYPSNYQSYKKACKEKKVQPGKVFVFNNGGIFNPKYIINFPTKRDWRSNSKYEDIKDGLESLTKIVQDYDIKSIAIPPLGCGLGGLNWRKVKPMIEQSFNSLPEVKVYIYEPKGAPSATEMPIGTKKPVMTVARALFIKLMEQYNKLNYRLSLLEIQKLAYFLQESGQDLRLNYVKFHYGPYAHNLNKVLELLEGHFIRGYGDNQNPEKKIELIQTAVNEADTFLEQKSKERERLNKVADLVEGYETPYGLELLGTVHWVINKEKATTFDEAINRINEWSNRKKLLFKEFHIQKAIERLEEHQLVNLK